MNASDKDVEALKHFFSCYFHQDWPLEATTSEGIVAGYLRSARASEIAQLHDALIRYAEDEIQGRNPSGHLDNKLNCYYLPSAGGISNADWLLGIADQLAAKIKK